MALTDAQLKVLAGDLATALASFRLAEQSLLAAKVAFARALGPNGSIVVQGQQVTANADATDLTITPTRVVV